jgi:hypothetical protein
MIRLFVIQYYLKTVRAGSEPLYTQFLHFHQQIIQL